MRILKKYKSLSKYLDRFTLIQIGSLHIRIHQIRSDDRTNLLHNHPFSYCTFVLRGGYDDVTKTERRRLRIGSILFRSSAIKHRIENVLPGTTTLFCTWCRSDNVWEVEGDAGANLAPGIYTRELYGKLRCCKYDQYWFKAHDDAIGAKQEVQPSIDQTSPAIELVIEDNA